MGLSSIYQKLVLASPRIEVGLRCLYWNNVGLLKRFRPDVESERSAGAKEVTPIDFDKILDFLRKSGVGEGDIMVLHSSFAALTGSGLGAEEVIDRILSVLGEDGTLAMPAIRHFPEEGEGDEYLKKYISDECRKVDTLYDIYRSTVSSGLLPFTLMRYDDAEISRFPLNPLVAVGNKAAMMMDGNISGELPSAHGPNSAWSYCARENAWNVGIGVGIKDYLTMFHVTQETSEWPVRDKEWYFERNFIIKKGKTQTPLRIKERKHKWTKYMAESNFYKDLHDAGVIKSAVIDGVEVHICRSSDMLEFISKQQNPTYPYLIPKKYFKNN